MSQHPICSILRDCYLVARLAVGLALLDLVVQLENGLAVLLDVRPEVRPILTLQMHWKSCAANNMKLTT
jgi:hypothetical protein